MSSSESDVLRLTGLQLVTLLDGYRQAVRSTAVAPDNEEAWNAAASALNRAGRCAFALPVIWPVWGDVVLRHAAFFEEASPSSLRAGLHAAWVRVDDRVEIVTQRCLDWALRHGLARVVDNDVADAFLTWDRARRELFHRGRQLAALHEGPVENRSVAVAVAARLRRACVEGGVVCAQLMARASAALHGKAGAEGSREHEALHMAWSLAEEAAVAAEIEIIEMQFQRVEVPASQRRHAAQLRNAATRCCQALPGTLEH